MSQYTIYSCNHFIVNFLYVILGSIPGPIIFGAAFDASCILWANQCKSKGSCLYYDNYRMGLYMFLLCGAVKLVGIIFLSLAWMLYKPAQDLILCELDVDCKKEKENSLSNGSIDNKDKAKVYVVPTEHLSRRKSEGLPMDNSQANIQKFKSLDT